MKKCLSCKNGFEPKRPHGKFCSDKCRVAYNRAHPQQSISKFQMQALYNDIKAFFENASQLKTVIPVTPEMAAALHNAENKDQMTTVVSYDYEGLKTLLKKSTSSYELRDNWKIVEAANWLAGWQKRELEKIREYQTTQIDF